MAGVNIMDLQKLYEDNKIQSRDRIINAKKIVLLGPSSDYDYGADLKKLGLDKHEVNYTYPKLSSSDFITEELKAIKPKLTIQVGGFQLSRKYPILPIDSEPNERLKMQAEAAIGDKFVNLHHHDEYSIRDGLGTVNQLIKQLKTQEKVFCCVTNHGGIGGWVKQRSLCKKNDIKALYGMEGYFNDYRGDDPEELKKSRSNGHLLLIVHTEEGFYNLIRIHNDAQLNGFYYKPRINKEALQKWGKGIIATSACLSGDIAKALIEDKWDKAKEWYDFFKSCFDEFYIELTMIESELQVAVNRKLIQFAQQVGAKMVVTCDSHYLKPEYAETHDLLMLIREHKTIQDKMENKEEVWQFDVRNLYYRNGQEMKILWCDGFKVENEEPDENGALVKKEHMAKYEDDVFTEAVFDECVSNTRQIALACQNIKWDTTLKLPKMYDDGEKILREKVLDGFNKRNLKGKMYHDRLNFELDMICELGYADYFLTMDRIIRLAKDNYGDFAVGFGRGSAAGSLVSYCLGLTDLEPIEYGLLFERFLDYSRRPVNACTFKV